MAQVYPKMKIVAILRNPVDRTISHYHHACRAGLEHRSLSQALRSHRQELDHNAHDPDKLNNYLATSLYAPALARWFACFPREQIQVVFSENLFQAPQTSLDGLCQFLEIHSYHLDTPTNCNPGKYQPSAPEIRQKLQEFFKPYNRQLQDLLDCPLPDQHFSL